MRRKKVLEFEKDIVDIEHEIEELKKNLAEHPELEDELKNLTEKLLSLKIRIYRNLDPWQKVQISRHDERPRFSNYLDTLFNDFIELHGDRKFGDDPAIIGGFGSIGGKKVVVVGHEKGHDIKRRVKHNFGLAHPEGFRKAARIFELAEKFHLPIITFIDTPGAYPGVEAEERGQAAAIAENLALLSDLRTPIVSVNIGEGGSGGALAIGVSDRFYMLENSYYSVITPEGCASILWKDGKKTREAAENLKLTADDLKALGIIDLIIPEPLGGAHHDTKETIKNVGEFLLDALNELVKIPLDQLIETRYEKLANIGEYIEI